MTEPPAVRLGSDGAAGASFARLLDEAVMFGRALTPADLTRLMHATTIAQ